MVAQNTPTQTLDPQSIVVTQQMSETFARVARSEELTKQVGSELSLNSINNDNITILVIPRTQLMKISVKDSFPDQAALIANKLVDVLAEKIDELQKSISPNNRAILEIVEKAIPDPVPIYPKMNFIAIVSVLMGLFIVLVMVYLFELFDTKIRDSDDVENVLPDVPILAIFPIIRSNTDKFGINQMRILRNNILFNRDKATYTLTFASFNVQEGTTYILSRLAMFLARSGKKVLLIDADFSRSGLTLITKLKSKPGLFDYLTAQNNGLESLPIDNWYHCDNGGGVDILPAGNVAQNAREVITSSKIDSLIIGLHQKYSYDFVLFDTAPIAESADSLAIVPKTNGLILVIESSKVLSYQLEHIKQEADLENFKIFGVVINKAKRRNLI